MADDVDPGERTRELIDAELFDSLPTEDEVRTAFEAELEASRNEDRPFSLPGFVSRMGRSGLERISPGVYLVRIPPDDTGWISGPC